MGELKRLIHSNYNVSIYLNFFFNLHIEWMKKRRE